ncbi:MAG: hypothetical protein KDB63_08375 [Nocardioidaceae bacterium]|nr:hypothetical protein [Nocardioidaceae bacterium]
MKLKTLVAVIAAVIGIGASAQAYRMASAPSSDVATVAKTTSADKASAPKVKVPHIVPETKFVWAPCEAPAVLQGKKCVTEVVQTVTLPSSGGSSSGGHHSEPAEHGGGNDHGDDHTNEPGDPPGDDHGDDDDHDHGGGEHEDPPGNDD